MTEPNRSDELMARWRTLIAGAVEEQIPRVTWTADEVAMHQRHKLRSLLAHAKQSSPYHADRLAGADARRFRVSELASLPVMTKRELMASFDDVVTDRRLTRALVEDHLAASVQEPKLLLGDYVCLASGGSSGVRGVFVQTIGEYAQFVASLRRRRAATVGGGASGRIVMALVGAASPVHASGFVSALGTAGLFRLVPVPATLPISEVVERLNALGPALLVGYPTMLARLARERNSGRLNIAPTSVTTTSEWLTDEDRDVITEAFGVPVVNQFVSTEGLSGQSDPGGTVITFASDLCIAELVDEENRPVPQGTASAKVLITNLHNFTQPLIRYELTDRFVAHDREEAPHLRATVVGRADDVFRYENVEIHPLVVRSVMVKTPAVLEYVVRQTARGLDVEVVTEEVIDELQLVRSLMESLRRAGLADPAVGVRVVPSLERHRQTGKIRRFVPRP